VIDEHLFEVLEVAATNHVGAIADGKDALDAELETQYAKRRENQIARTHAVRCPRDTPIPLDCVDHGASLKSADVR
jgi:hypothetical protein